MTTCVDCLMKMGEKVPLLARSIGGRVLGPRPGLAIVTFWQGIVEITLRLIAAVMCIAAVVPACIAFSVTNSESSSMRREVHATAGLVLGVASAGFVLELGLIILRIVNVGVINYKIKWLLLSDFVLSVLLSVLLVAGCAACAYASDHAAEQGKDTVVSVLIATTAMSFFAATSLVVIGAWSFLFMWFKWNKHVVTYTLRNAVLG